MAPREEAPVTDVPEASSAAWSTRRVALAVAIVALALAAVGALLLRAPSSPLVIVAGDELDDVDLDEELETDPADDETELEDEREDEREVAPTPAPSPGTTPGPREEEDEEEDDPGTARLQTAEDEDEDDGEGRGRAARLAGEHPGRGQGRGTGRADGQGLGPPSWAPGARVSTYARDTSWLHFPDGGCERGQAIAAVARGEIAPDDLAPGLPAHLAERCAAED